LKQGLKQQSVPDDEIDSFVRAILLEQLRRPSGRG
jgi:hypothetical protein